MENNNELLLNEAFVEFWAIILNAILLSYDVTNNIKVKKIINLINLELQFSLLQSAKILKHAGFNTFQEFMQKSDKKLIQQTHVFSYFIIKTALLFNIIIISQLNIHNNLSRESFSKLILNCLNNPNFHLHMNNNIAQLHNHKYYSSLRMSLFG